MICPNNMITDKSTGLIFLRSADEIYVTLGSVLEYIKNQEHDIIEFLHNEPLEKWNNIELLDIEQLFKVLVKFHRRSLFMFFESGISAYYDRLDTLRDLLH